MATTINKRISQSERDSDSNYSIISVVLGVLAALLLVGVFMAYIWPNLLESSAGVVESESKTSVNVALPSSENTASTPAM